MFIGKVTNGSSSLSLFLEVKDNLFYIFLFASLFCALQKQTDKKLDILFIIFSVWLTKSLIFTCIDFLFLVLVVQRCGGLMTFLSPFVFLGHR